MFFALLILLLIGAIAYFHYTQGLLSATLSALLAILAAAVAVSYHEPVATVLLKGSIPDYVHAASLAILFGVVYVILRVIFDKAVPGNVQFPLWVDRIGGAAMGVIAAVYATGTLAVAAQALPFNASILGYSRYKLMDDREVSVKPERGSGRDQFREGTTSNELAGGTVEMAQRQRMPLPVDDWVIGTVRFMSDGGSLAGKRPMASVHPNYLDELFFTRLGIQSDANRTALDVGDQEQVKVEDLYVYDEISEQVDAELADYRPDRQAIAYPTRADEGQTFLVVRTVFDKDAAEQESGLVHFSPAMVRLVVGDEEEGWENIHPIGTLGEARRLYANRVDDFLFVRFPQNASQASADLVFLVDAAKVLVDTGAEQPQVKQGVFVEVKRMAAVDLSGKAVYTQAITADPRSGVMRKRDVMAPAEPPPAAAAKPAAAPKPAAPQQAAPKPPPQRQTTPQRPVGR